MVSPGPAPRAPRRATDLLKIVETVAAAGKAMPIGTVVLREFSTRRAPRRSRRPLGPAGGGAVKDEPGAAK